MNPDSAALHPGYLVIQPVVQGITGFSEWSKWPPVVDPYHQKNLSPYARGEFAYGLSRVA